MKESSLLDEGMDAAPVVVAGVVAEHCVDSSLAFRVVIALATDDKQEVPDDSDPVLVPDQKTVTQLVHQNTVH